MNQAEIIARLQVIFDDIFLEPVQVTAELKAGDVPEWDSLKQLSVVMAVEKAFNMRFRVGEWEKARNVGEFAGLIGRRLEER